MWSASDSFLYSFSSDTNLRTPRSICRNKNMLFFLEYWWRRTLLYSFVWGWRGRQVWGPTQNPSRHDIRLPSACRSSIQRRAAQSLSWNRTCNKECTKLGYRRKLIAYSEEFEKPERVTSGRCRDIEEATKEDDEDSKGFEACPGDSSHLSG